MNNKKIISGYKLLWRSTKLFLLAFPKFEIMKSRFKQILICCRVICQGFFDK
jgi:hypothetical protein